MSVHLLLSLYFAALGLILGSYLNVVIYRLPRRMSTVTPRSRCPRCRVAIPPWDNIPLLSYIWLRGKCRRCGFAIPWRYPAIEAATGAGFVAVYHTFGWTTDSVVAAFFLATMIVLAMIDLEHYILPDVLTLPGIVLGLALQPWIHWTSLADAVIGAVLGAAILYGVAWGWYIWKGVWGMGFGDVKMLAMVGAFLGWKGVIVTLFLASVAGSLVGAVLILLGRLRLQSKLPFGVFLAAGAVLALFFGQTLMDRYMTMTAALLGS